MVAFDPNAERAVEKEMWRRAWAFRELHNTAKVVKLQNGVCCCRARASAAGPDEADRGDIELADAQRVQEIGHKLLHGQSVSYAEVKQYSECYLFYRQRGTRHSAASHCTCPSFMPFMRCKHTLGTGLRFGADLLPDDVDFTPLADGARGRKRKAGDCYSKGTEVQKRKADLPSLQECLAKHRSAPRPGKRLRCKQACGAQAASIFNSHPGRPMPRRINTRTSDEPSGERAFV